MRTFALFALPLTLAACVEQSAPSMPDNSLEAHSLSGLDSSDAPAGALAVVAGADEGDWTLTLGETTFDYHSPSHADLSALAGRTLTASVSEQWDSAAPPFQLREGEQVVFAVEPADDGTGLFGETRWEYGEILGGGDVVNEYDESTLVIFRAVTVHTDDGDLTVLPGEPASVVLDGATWRLTVLASYEIDPDNWPDGEMPGCGPSDMLSVELMLTDEDAGEPLVRPTGRVAAMQSCG